MKLNPIMLAFSLALVVSSVGGQTVGSAIDESGFKKFLIYPHLQKGFEALERGNKNRAIAEFEQALTLAPNNITVITYLAEAYRRFGERNRAETLLTEQLGRNPENLQLGKALKDLRAEEPQNSSAQTSQQYATSVLSANSSKPVKPVKPVARQTLHPSKVAQFTTLTNLAYASAHKAYQAIARGDFQSAAVGARKAVQLAPDNRAYRKMLVYVLAQNGAYLEADALAGELLASAHTDSDSELIAQRKLVRQRLAFLNFEASNKAMSDGNLESAYQEARKGVEYAPELRAHHLQLIRSLIAIGRIEEAHQTATDAIKKLPDEAALYVIRGYTAQRLGQRVEAWADFDKAIENKTLTPKEQQNFRTIAAQAALVAGEPKRALSLLAPLDAVDEGIAAWRSSTSPCSHCCTTQPGSISPETKCISQYQHSTWSPSTGRHLRRLFIYAGLRCLAR